MEATSRPVAAAPSVPADGFQGLKKHWREDLGAGLLVSLIALPLCLGIAMASGFPPYGGLITAIVGGLIVAPLCGSPLTIKGPAAGLIAIAIGSVEALGQGDSGAGYRMTLAVIVVASVIQIFLALAKMGRLADVFPLSVVHGMLAAIGVIIFSKQVHPLLGVKPIARDPLPLLLEIPHSIAAMKPEIAIIGIASVLLVLFSSKLLGRLAAFLPGPLVAVVAGVGFTLYFDLHHPTGGGSEGQAPLGVAEFLVKLPQPFFSGVTFPDFSRIFTGTALQFILLFSLIGTIESLLTDKAIDTLDPAGRKAEMDRDLLAVGIGNLVSGLIGGLPMISEVVRSSANVNYGAKTRWANFYHGVFILLFVVVLSPLIQLVPKAALAGVLCVTGYRLAAPKNFRHCREVGTEQLIMFVVTIVATLMTDLLIGVFLGIFTKLVVCFAMGVTPRTLRSSVRPEVINEKTSCVMKLPAACLFSSVLGLKKAIQRAEGRSIVLDFSGTHFIDHTFMVELGRMRRDLELTLIGFDELAPLSSHRDAARRRRGEVQADLVVAP